MPQEQEKQIFQRAMGQTLQSARVAAAIPLAEVSAATSISEADLLGYEEGESALDVYTLHCIASALGVTAPALLDAATRLFHEQQNAPFNADRETQEAGELIRRFLHVEGSSRGEKFMHLVNELKKND
ncbi:MAG: helix-turn-helix transcriptional regulator [Alphaproteobacteria bacterium]|nr:helix-turn-helix transcriptional regulator [Alphaproteobacteria bacterium]